MAVSYTHLTDELKEQILKAETMVLVEDLYRPYKQKRRTRATIAREKGLEQLAEYIKGQDAKEDVLVEAEKYVSDEEGKEVKSAQEADVYKRQVKGKALHDEAGRKCTEIIRYQR